MRGVQNPGQTDIHSMRTKSVDLTRACIVLFLCLEGGAMLFMGIRGDYAAALAICSAWGKEGIRKRREDTHGSSWHINSPTITFHTKGFKS